MFVLLSALAETIGDKINDNIKRRRMRKERRRYENIDFDNIKSVIFHGTETAYRIVEEEEFDLVMSDFLTQQDGWQHYETKTVEYEVEDGENY